MRNDIPKSRLLAAFLLTVVIFLSIILTNNYFNEARLNQLNSLYNSIRIDAFNAEVQYEILSENPCLALNFQPITNELYELGNKLTEMENALGKTNQQVLDLKGYYSVLEARHWLFVKKASQRCVTNATPIMFFYSNAGDCADCEQQGFVLNYIRNYVRNSNNTVYIYSFDFNLDSSAVDALKHIYNITTVPAVVIKDTVYYGFKNADDLKAYVVK